MKNVSTSAPSSGNPVHEPDRRAGEDWTPGPWSVFDDVYPGIEAHALQFSVVVIGDDDDDGDYAGVRGRTPDETLANARLIAAAPELYEALSGNWADNLAAFILREFAEPDPTKGEAVTSDVRPYFNALCDFLAARDKAIIKALGTEAGIMQGGSTTSDVGGNK